MVLRGTRLAHNTCTSYCAHSTSAAVGALCSIFTCTCTLYVYMYTCRCACASSVRVCMSSIMCYVLCSSVVVGRIRQYKVSLYHLINSTHVPCVLLHRPSCSVFTCTLQVYRCFMCVCTCTVCVYGACLCVCGGKGLSAHSKPHVAWQQVHLCMCIW